MSVDFKQFDELAIVILKKLANEFPSATEIGFHDIFPDEDDNTEKRAAHIGVLTFLRHEQFIAHDTGSVSSFIITRDGLSLFGHDIVEHLKAKLSD